MVPCSTEIICEAFQVLRPAVATLSASSALTPGRVDEAVTTKIRRVLPQSIKFNTRALTAAECRQLACRSCTGISTL